MTFSITCKDVSLTYKNFTALKDVSFSLSGGKIYGLIGRNGAGKTTLLSALAAFREVTSGSIKIDGEDPFENARIMESIAFLYDTDYQEESNKVQTMLETVDHYRPYFDLNYAIDLAKRFRLPLDKPANKLSKGMQSALNVTMGLASRSPVTIFDESYLGMDAPTREVFYKELLEEQEKHPRTFIISTHLVSEMDYLFDEVLILNQGEIVLHEDFETVTSRGASITGSKEDVDSFVQGVEILNEQQLGNTKSVMVYGQLSEEKVQKAAQMDLDIGNVSLQDLFIHLTNEGDEDELSK